MIWYPFKFAPDRYEINKLGQLRGFKYKKILKAYVDKGGYLRVSPFFNKDQTIFGVHRLIAQHFIPNPLELPQVNHKDGNKLNNAISNLEWVTAQRNTEHAYELGLSKGRPGVKHHNAKLTEKEVLEIRELVGQGVARKILAKKYNVGTTQINRIVTKARWGHI